MSGSGRLRWTSADWRFERLAMRWHVTPYEIERELDDPLVQEWVTRGLIHMRVADVEVVSG
jgi:hypothetical protein